MWGWPVFPWDTSYCPGGEAEVGGVGKWAWRTLSATLGTQDMIVTVAGRQDTLEIRGSRGSVKGRCSVTQPQHWSVSSGAGHSSHQPKAGTSGRVFRCCCVSMMSSRCPWYLEVRCHPILQM